MVAMDLGGVPSMDGSINFKGYFSKEQADQARARLAEVMADETYLKLIPLTSDVFSEELETLIPDGLIVTTDFYVDQIEKNGKFLFVEGLEMPIGFELRDRIVNLDHHAPVKEFARTISSGNLAIEYVRHNGVVPNNATVVGSHTDCDSVIALGILTGILPPDDIFGDAVIAADHTGAPNDIADLLQGLDKRRDLQYSLEQLIKLLEGAPLSEAASAAIQKRRDARALIAEIVQDEDRFVRLNSDKGEVVFLVTDEKAGLQSDLVAPFFPTAAVIVIEEVNGAKRCARVRLGTVGIESNLSIDDFSLRSIDPNYGGRFNAGSNRRGGGLREGLTGLDIAEYICSYLNGHN